MHMAWNQMTALHSQVVRRGWKLLAIIGATALTFYVKGCPARSNPYLLNALDSPVVFRGDARTAYRDPAAVYSAGWFYLYFTVTKIEATGQVFEYLAWSKSSDLTHWTMPKIITPRDNRLNYSSPGNVIRFAGEWIICVQTYPRPNGEKYGNENARIWIMRSKDLEHWSTPELLRVKGPNVPVEQVGRMIDPFLLEDKDDPGKWWCFFKQDGVSRSWSRDLRNWTFVGSANAGENVCVIVDGGHYVMFQSPENGIDVERSSDLQTWQDLGVLTLGQKDWAWAHGRVTAGFVLDARQVPGVGEYLMFFHGSKYSEDDARGGFDNFSSIGIAWSRNLKEWDWPGKPRDRNPNDVAIPVNCCSLDGN